MQDWEIEVADPERIEEFLAAYESGELDDDEKFTLMQTIIESFEVGDQPLQEMPAWHRALSLIEENLDLHIYSVWYWGSEENGVEDHWQVHEYFSKLLEKHRTEYEEG